MEMKCFKCVGSSLMGHLSSNSSQEHYLVFSKSTVKAAEKTVTDSLAQMMDDGGKQRSGGRVAKRKEVHVKLVD
jgi:hypothetical protein